MTCHYYIVFWYTSIMIKEFQGKYRWLSNFWPVEITYNGLLFPSLEHAYMSAKNNSKEWKYFCVQEKNPKIVKKRSYEIDLVPDWDNKKLEIMNNLISIKFKNRELRKKLLQTKNTYIQEGNTWNDTFWGVDIKTKKGENNLGKIIMQVRDEIKKSHILFKFLQEKKKIILFDGECNLCDWSVQLLLENDPHDVFRFASLQSNRGKEIQGEYGIDSTAMSSIIIIDDYSGYKSKTSAVFSITRSMGKFWYLFNIFWIVPQPIRDWIYTKIAKNRYTWFGKKNTCIIMTEDIRHKFLDENE